MAEIELSSQKDFERTIANGVTLVDFNAPWCAPCRAQDPVLKQLAEAYNGQAAVAKVNLDEARDIALSLQIQSIPTLIIYREGGELHRFVGLQSAETLQKALDNALN